MKYYSEITKRKYDTVEELESAEAEYEKAKAEKEEAFMQRKKEREEALEQRRLDRAKAAKDLEIILGRVSDARKKVNEARQELLQVEKEYQEALRAFCSKYGAYHTTIREPLSSIFDLFWDF